jgi:uncharacterized membrane protein
VKRALTCIEVTTKKELEKCGYKVNGYLGWVTLQRTKVKTIARFYDSVVWNVPMLVDSLIEIKTPKEILG